MTDLTALAASLAASPVLDPPGAAIVVAGTAIATLLRVGPAQMLGALKRALALLRRRFDPAVHRARLARDIERIRRDGVIRAQTVPVEDPGIDEAQRALLRHRSIHAMIEAHERFRILRRKESESAQAVFEQAGDLAPLMGLAGTLLALGGLPSSKIGSEADILGAVALAVGSTLFGLFLAHLVFFPLAAAIARRAQWEEDARSQLIAWLASQLADACPSDGRSQIPAGPLQPVRSTNFDKDDKGSIAA